MLADTLGRYLQQRYPIETRHEISGSGAGWSKEHWAALAEIGVVGALFDEGAGGFGGDGFDIAVVFEQLGRALSVEPFLGTLMAGRVLARAGGHQALIDDVLGGRAVLAFAQDEEAARYDIACTETRAVMSAGEWSLSGVKIAVPLAESADALIVLARTSGQPADANGLGLFLVRGDAPGLTVRGYQFIDGGRGGEVVLDGAPATAVLLNDAHALTEDALAAGTLALVWEAVGAMDVVRGATLDYLRTRRQFGVPIGKFQALQHRMATLALEIEQARSAAINAADALDGPAVLRNRAISAAKFTIDRVGVLVAEEAIQMHGGIGMTWELPLSHYAKRLTMIGHQLGDEDHHLARYISTARAA